ncbi:putative bifunctional UDP-N-acetylglucosamine transferase and deubiquitinase ALG13 isoform X2 [Eucyclogobius newberryi]|uniref:putative bifunctional UDP-N-acetylglucosamine transferase and deubiquitinase ALG13 isoform X2 n=1 Tax=Eucyclogobius newberryi TaxID=166745 RepID=UPI003B597BA3
MQKGLKKYFVNMDEYLCSLGLYRKMVARDASSLFRAVSEQLYFSQNYHQKIRQDCADHMRANHVHFDPFVEGSFEKYLQRLEDPKETVGQVEIKALSQLYRRCFLIYRYPGKPATVIADEDYTEKVTLCCSINGHYDIVYPRSYPQSAALCQSLVFEVLYVGVFGLEEADLVQALDQFRVGGRRFRNSLSVCSDQDLNPDYDREEVEPGVTSEKFRPPAEEAPPPARLTLPYKVLKSLDGDVYRNLEFDVWQDSCKELQKTDYMVFAGRQYFLGDKCQVRLEAKGKFYNAFIQEVGNHSSAVTVFIEELGEKHLVPLTDLKPVNPVPAWNVAPCRKDLEPDSRGHRHRHRFFRKVRGKGSDLVLAPPSFTGQNQVLPPRFQPTPRPPPPPSPTALTYDPYAPPPTPHHHPRGQRYAPPSSARFLNRHLIGPQLTYYHPGRRYYHDYDGYAFRSRRARRQVSKDGSFGFSLDSVDDSELYFPLEQIPAPPPAHGPAYRPPQAPPITQAPPPNSSAVSSDEENANAQEFTEDFIYSSQDPSFQTVVYNEPSSTQDEQENEAVESPQRQDLDYNYTQQVKPMLGSSPSSSSSSSCSSPATTHPPPRPVPVPAAAPWMVNELGEPVCAVVAPPPPPYSYDPSGGDLPRDCRVLQYYYNLGVQPPHNHTLLLPPPTRTVPEPRSPRTTTQLLAPPSTCLAPPPCTQTLPLLCCTSPMRLRPLTCITLPFTAAIGPRSRPHPLESTALRPPPPTWSAT